MLSNEENVIRQNIITKNDKKRRNEKKDYLSIELTYLFRIIVLQCIISLGKIIINANYSQRTFPQLF
jgi:hypothetical protein